MFSLLTPEARLTLAPLPLLEQTWWSTTRSYYILNKGSNTPASNLGYLAPPPPQKHFSWVPNCSLGPPGWETKVSSKIFWFGLCEIAWFLWQPVANLKGGSAYKITHISAVTYPRLLNLIPNWSLDIGILSPCCICKFSNLHIHKYLWNY